MAMAVNAAASPTVSPAKRAMATAAASTSAPVPMATNGAGPNNGSPTPPGSSKPSPSYPHNRSCPVRIQRTHVAPNPSSSPPATPPADGHSPYAHHYTRPGQTLPTTAADYPF